MVLNPFALRRDVDVLFLFMVNGNAAALHIGCERHLHMALWTSLTLSARLGTDYQELSVKTEVKYFWE